MNFMKHSNLVGKHALLGASTYHWINYSDDKVADYFLKMQAKSRGTELHEFAAQCIKLRQKLPRTNLTLNMYVNDAIGYRMTPEQVLYYSDNCFGTADSISFKDGLLRIHDLKTGTTIAHMEQLLIYDALFCLEYKIDPSKIQIENRIYQNDEKIIATPDDEDIRPIMERIISADKIINNVKNDI